MASELKKLIERAQLGNKDAFGRIYELFFSKIYRFIYFSLGDKELSEDLAQNTFLRCWRSLQSFSDTKGSFQAFLFTIARNILIDWYRKKKEVSLEKVEDPASLENIESEAVKKEEKEIVWNALLRLKEFEKQVVILRYFEELSFADIAKIVGKKETAVRVKLHRTLKKMKHYLEKKT